jgi:ribonuclease HI
LLATALLAPEVAPRRLRLLPRATDNTIRHRVPRWLSESSARIQLVKTRRACETSSLRIRLKTLRSQPGAGDEVFHDRTDGSFREGAEFGWIVTEDDKGKGPPIAQGSDNLGSQPTAFDAEQAAMKRAMPWFQGSEKQQMTIHSYSTSAIGRAGHTAAGPGQGIARNVRNMVCNLQVMSRTVDRVWVKGHEGKPGNEKADVFSGKGCRDTWALQSHVHRKPETLEF